MPEPAIAQNRVCSVLGWEEKKSQAESCAVAACGISLSGLGFTEWMRSGNWIASWMKNTGMLLPTMSCGAQVSLLFPMRPQQIRPTEVALVGVEPGGEAVDVSRGISTPTRARHGREAHKRRRVLAWSTQERSSRDVAPIRIALEGAKGPGAASVDSALRYLRSKSVTRYTH